MAVRHRDKELRARLDSVIDRRRSEITAILQEYSVPLLDLGAPATPGAPHGTPSGSVAPTRDTVRDSLLVSDSIYQGWKWFHVYCFRCHGEDAQHPVIATAPDLRWVLSKSGMAYPRDSFEYTVLNGRPDKGMPSWKVLLDTRSEERLNSSHSQISYAVFCLKKKKRYAVASGLGRRGKAGRLNNGTDGRRSRRAAPIE